MSWTFTPDSSYLRHVYPEVAFALEDVLIEHQLKQENYNFLTSTVDNGTMYSILLTRNLLMEISPIDRGMQGIFEWMAFHKDQESSEYKLVESVRALVKISDQSQIGGAAQLLFCYSIAADSLKEIINIALSGLKYFTGIQSLPTRLQVESH